MTYTLTVITGISHNDPGRVTQVPLSADGRTNVEATLDAISGTVRTGFGWIDTCGTTYTFSKTEEIL